MWTVNDMSLLGDNKPTSRTAFLSAQSSFIINTHIILEMNRGRDVNFIIDPYMNKVESFWLYQLLLRFNAQTRDRERVDAPGYGDKALDVSSFLTSYFQNVGQWTGNWRGPYLLVGDKSTNWQELSIPFHFPYRSGLYLARTLLKINFMTCCTFVNANEQRSFDLIGMWQRSHASYGRVVALGHSAHRTLRYYDVPHTLVPHPAFVWRFEKNKAPSMASYANQILEAVGSAHRVAPTPDDLDMRSYVEPADIGTAD